jgi:hypothetical protein
VIQHILSGVWRERLSTGVWKHSVICSCGWQSQARSSESSSLKIFTDHCRQSKEVQQ